MSVYRPELHLTADRGILDAAAGILRDKDPAGGEDTWHVFYQYRPTPESPSRWGHSISVGTAFDWLECNDAVVPAGGETGLRAGSVVADGSGADLYFTSVTEADMTIQRAHVEDLDALSTDVDNEYTADPAVKRIGSVVRDQDGFHRFRSPCVVPNWREVDNRDKGQSGWLMLAMSGEPEQPQPVVLSSTDGRDWTVVGPLEFDSNPGFDVEEEKIVAPRIIRLRDEVDSTIYDVIMLTLERDGKDSTGYIVGTLRGNVFHVVRKARLIDYGHDFTRPRVTNYTAETMLEEKSFSHGYIFGVMAETGRGGNPTSEQNWQTGGWATALSLPRRLTLQDGALYQTPPRGLPDAAEVSSRANLWTERCEIPVGTSSSLVAEVLDVNGEVAAVITHTGDTLTLDRLDGAPSTAPIREDDEHSITVVVDSSTIEVFADGGAVTISSRFWPAGGKTNLRVSTTGEARILNQWHSGALRFSQPE